MATNQMIVPNCFPLSYVVFRAIPEYSFSEFHVAFILSPDRSETTYGPYWRWFQSEIKQFVKIL